MKRLLAGLLAALIAAACAYVATADNVQFGFWGWDRVPDHVSLGGNQYDLSQACTGVTLGGGYERRATLWTIVGPRRAISAIQPIKGSGPEPPPGLYIERAEGCIAAYRLRTV